MAQPSNPQGSRRSSHDGLNTSETRRKVARPSRDAKAPGIPLYELQLDRDRAVNMGSPELLDSIMRQPHRHGDAPTAERTESPATDPDLPLLRKGLTAASRSKNS